MDNRASRRAKWKQRWTWLDNIDSALSWYERLPGFVKGVLRVTPVVVAYLWAWLAENWWPLLLIALPFVWVGVEVWWHRYQKKPVAGQDVGEMAPQERSAAEGATTVEKPADEWVSVKSLIRQAAGLSDFLSGLTGNVHVSIERGKTVKWIGEVKAELETIDPALRKRFHNHALPVKNIPTDRVGLMRYLIRQRKFLVQLMQESTEDLPRGAEEGGTVDCGIECCPDSRWGHIHYRVEGSTRSREAMLGGLQIKNVGAKRSRFKARVVYADGTDDRNWPAPWELTGDQYEELAPGESGWLLLFSVEERQKDDRRTYAPFRVGLTDDGHYRLHKQFLTEKPIRAVVHTWDDFGNQWAVEVRIGINSDGSPIKELIKECERVDP
jgi:hypothetical protein